MTSGKKSSGTFFGSHEWYFNKLENFAITFGKKSTFNMGSTKYLHNLIGDQAMFNIWLQFVSNIHTAK